MKQFAALVAGASIALMVQAAGAADIHVLSAMGMKSVLEAAKPDFEAESGDRLIIAYGTAGLVRKRIEDGERPDVVFVQRPWLDTLKDADLLINASAVDLAYSAVGLVARAGTPKQDISSKDKLIHVLQAAQSIAYTDPKAGGLSGSHFAKLSRDFGMEEEIRRKSVLGTPMARVSSGEVEYAVLQLSEIVTLKNVVFIGPFPPGVQETTPTSAAVLRSSRVSTEATKLLEYLRLPAAGALFKEKGMTPAQ
ncbi:MAG: substrate-binding domain-containing protein [Pseudacidovorax sp.]|nr:substrate-binding domain-containing protein [Pseudacidovorax sp.]